MTQLAKLAGVRMAITKLRKRRDHHAAQTERNLKAAGRFLLGKSMEVVPVDTGDLRRSGRVRSEGKGFKTKVRVVYLQSYAIYVHEDLQARHAPGKTAKYLERPARQYFKQISQIAGGHVKIGKIQAVGATG